MASLPSATCPAPAQTEGLRDGSAARPELERFSIIRLSTFGKEKGMHKDGTYKGQWRESWRAHLV